MEQLQAGEEHEEEGQAREDGQAAVNRSSVIAATAGSAAVEAASKVASSISIADFLAGDDSDDEEMAAQVAQQRQEAKAHELNGAGALAAPTAAVEDDDDDDDDDDDGDGDGEDQAPGDSPAPAHSDSLSGREEEEGMTSDPSEAVAGVEPIAVAVEEGAGAEVDPSGAEAGQEAEAEAEDAQLTKKELKRKRKQEKYGDETKEQRKARKAHKKEKKLRKQAKREAASAALEAQSSNSEGSESADLIAASAPSVSVRIDPTIIAIEVDSGDECKAETEEHQEEEEATAIGAANEDSDEEGIDGAMEGESEDESSRARSPFGAFPNSDDSDFSDEASAANKPKTAKPLSAAMQSLLRKIRAKAMQVSAIRIAVEEADALRIASMPAELSLECMGSEVVLEEVGGSEEEGGSDEFASSSDPDRDDNEVEEASRSDEDKGEEEGIQHSVLAPELGLLDASTNLLAPQTEASASAAHSDRAPNIASSHVSAPEVIVLDETTDSQMADAEVEVRGHAVVPATIAKGSESEDEIEMDGDVVPEWMKANQTETHRLIPPATTNIGAEVATAAAAESLVNSSTKDEVAHGASVATPRTDATVDVPVPIVAAAAAAAAADSAADAATESRTATDSSPLANTASSPTVRVAAAAAPLSRTHRAASLAEPSQLMPRIVIPSITAAGASMAASSRTATSARSVSPSSRAGSIAVAFSRTNSSAPLTKKQANKERATSRAAKADQATGAAKCSSQTASSSPPPSSIDDEVEDASEEEGHGGGGDDESDNCEGEEMSDEEVDEEEEAAGLAEIARDFLSPEEESCAERDYEERGLAMDLNRQLEEDRELAEIAALQKKLRVHDPRAARAAAAAAAAAATASPAASPAPKPSRPLNLRDQLLEAARTADELGLANVRAARARMLGLDDSTAAGRGGEAGGGARDDEEAHAILELERRKAEKIELRNLKLARRSLIRPQQRTDEEEGAPGGRPPAASSRAAASPSPYGRKLSRTDSLSSSHSSLTTRTSSLSPSPPLSLLNRTSQQLLRGICKTNVSASFSRTKSALPPSSAAGAAASSSGAGFARAHSAITFAPAAKFSPSTSAGRSTGGGPVSNFESFNQEIRRRANISLIRTGSFLQRGSSSGGALLKRGLSEIMQTAGGARGAASQPGTHPPAAGETDAKDPTHKLPASASRSSSSPVVPGGKLAPSSMGGMAAAKMAKKSNQTVKAFVFKRQDALKEGANKENSCPSDLNRSGATGNTSNSSSSLAAAAAAVTSTGGLTGVSRTASFASFLAPPRSSKRQSSNNSTLSGYEEKTEQSHGSALFNKLKKARP